MITKSAPNSFAPSPQIFPHSHEDPAGPPTPPSFVWVVLPTPAAWCNTNLMTFAPRVLTSSPIGIPVNRGRGWTFPIGYALRSSYFNVLVVQSSIHWVTCAFISSADEILGSPPLSIALRVCSATAIAICLAEGFTVIVLF